MHVYMKVFVADGEMSKIMMLVYIVIVIMTKVININSVYKYLNKLLII